MYLLRVRQAPRRETIVPASSQTISLPSSREILQAPAPARPGAVTRASAALKLETAVIGVTGPRSLSLVAAGLIWRSSSSRQSLSRPRHHRQRWKRARLPSRRRQNPLLEVSGERSRPGHRWSPRGDVTRISQRSISTPSGRSGRDGTGHPGQATPTGPRPESPHAATDTGPPPVQGEAQQGAYRESTTGSHAHSVTSPEEAKRPPGRRHPAGHQTSGTPQRNGRRRQQRQR